MISENLALPNFVNQVYKIFNYYMKQERVCFKIFLLFALERNHQNVLATPSEMTRQRTVQNINIHR